jgi:hypothetical protein
LGSSEYLRDKKIVVKEGVKGVLLIDAEHSIIIMLSAAHEWARERIHLPEIFLYLACESRTRTTNEGPPSSLTSS